MLYEILQPIWHYIKCVIVKRNEIGIIKKKKFYSFGKKSIIMKPYLQLSGIENVSIGKGTTILDGCRLSVYGNGEDDIIIIGNRCYIGYGFSALAASGGKIIIGDDVLFASNVIITNENHGIDPEQEIPYMNQNLCCKSVKVGDGCWIGEKVSILAGSTIGEKCIIGANAVVSGNIPDYSIAVGIPAKVVKMYNFKTHKWERV